MNYSSAESEYVYRRERRMFRSLLTEREYKARRKSRRAAKLARRKNRRA